MDENGCISFIQIWGDSPKRRALLSCSKGVGSGLVHPGDDAKMRQGALEGGFPVSSCYDPPQADYVIKLIQLPPKSSRRHSRLADPLNRVLLNRDHLIGTT